ncbi:hypothetical protein C489_13036 [Natrinema versiforme JCM 10478]|uniref:Zinc-ribbon domain-containing protein n=1 Tax=Natrinema versiforme JCM 10478 TaxID=1227496 RepID=L9XXQ0_9EURY|nr:hypothetical protein C489_13036 [Natrinema versiforme JCM 10478]
MGVLKTIRECVGGESRTLHECRNCGEKIGKDTERCPCCGTTEIAHYEF